MSQEAAGQLSGPSLPAPLKGGSKLTKVPLSGEVGVGA